jgi:hypothetical protein
MKRIFLTCVFISVFSTYVYSLSIPTPPPVYIPIDSVSEKHLNYNVNLNFLKNEFTYEIEGKILSFNLKNDIQQYSSISIDTVKNARSNYFPSMHVLFDEKTEIYFGFDKLRAFTEDSIYVSARYQKFSIEKGYNTGKICEIQSIAISRKDLSGLQLLFYPEGTANIQNQLIAGYAFTRGGKNNTTSHAIELGWSKITSAYHNIFTSSYYLANEFAFNNNAFFLGPKAGGQISFFIYGLGTEFVYYTDFHDSSLQWIPFFYLGLGNYKLHFDAHIPIYNKKFQNMNNFSIGFSMPVLPLSKKKVKP